MEFKGTKGDWKVKHSESKTAYNVVGTVLGGMYKIARCPYIEIVDCDILNDREKAEAKANAQLTASAPKLLEKAVIALADLKYLLDEVKAINPGSYRAEHTIRNLEKVINESLNNHGNNNKESGDVG